MVQAIHLISETHYFFRIALCVSVDIKPLTMHFECVTSVMWNDLKNNISKKFQDAKSNKIFS